LVRQTEGEGTFQVTATTFGTAAPSCTGDCNSDGAVTVDEVVKGVDIALGSAAIAECPSFAASGESVVTVDALITAVINALGACPAS
jgi:hypothetical protein